MSTKHSLSTIAVRAEHDRSTWVVDLQRRSGGPPTPEQVLQPGFWADMSTTVGAGDTIIARYGPLPADEIRLRVVSVYPGGAVRVAVAGAEDDAIDPEDSQPRNLLVCLRDSRHRHTWTACQKERGRWVEFWNGPQTLDLVTRSLIEQYDPTIDASAWPDLTIASRGLDEILQDVSRPIPAGRDDAYASVGLAALAADASVTLLCPIGRSDGQWSTAMSIDRRQGFHAADHHSTRFVAKTLRDRILDYFADGSTIVMGRPPTWKQFASSRRLLLVRPHWRLMNVCPGVFAEPTYVPVMSEEAKRKYREAEEHLADVARVASHHESQGQTYNPETHAWSPPSRED